MGLATTTGADRSDRLRRLAAHGAALDRETDEATVLERTAEVVSDVVDADATAVVRVLLGTATLVAHRGLAADRAAGWQVPVEQLAAFPVLRERCARTGTDAAFDADRPEGDRLRLEAFCAAPVVIDDQVELLLYALRRTTEPFGGHECAVLSLLAGQVAAALQRIRAVEALEQRRRLAERLRTVTRDLGETLDRPTVLARVCESVLALTSYDRVSVLLLDEDRLGLRLVHGEGTGSERMAPLLRDVLARIPVRDSEIMRAALEQGRSFARRVDTPSGTRLGELFDEVTDAVSVCVQPLVVDDRALGLLLLEQLHDGPADPEQEAVLEQVSTTGAVALRHAGQFQRLELNRGQLRALHDVTLSIGASDDLATTLQRITDAAARLTGAERCRLGLRTPARPLGRGPADPPTATPDSYRLAAVTGDTDGAGATYALTETVGGWVVLNNRPAWLPDLAAGIAEPPECLAHARRPEGSALAVPVRGRDGGAVGFLSLHDPRPAHFRREVSDLLERFAAEAALALDNDTAACERRELEDQLREQAHHDPLTGLPNRALLLEQLDAALLASSTGQHVGVLFVDLDRFKAVNDSLGHAGGDDLLIRVAHVINAVTRPDDLVARLGGDEFVVLATGLTSPAAASELADRVLEALLPPLAVGDRQVFVSASIGVVTAKGQRRDAVQVLRDADIAMYQAKKGGRSRSVVFRNAMRTSASRQLPLETELRQALDAGELVVHYQPIVETAGGQLTGFEALVRWQHPVRGLVGPDAFVPIAEETRLITRVDDVVMRSATAQVRRWQVEHGLPWLGVNVNLSAVSLHHPGAAARIRAALDASGLAPGALTVELTESATMQDPEACTAVLHELRRLGLQLAIDDFGTGYSNLGYLDRLPVDGLKVDRQFTSLLSGGGTGEPVVRAVLGLAEAFGLVVTAEGVETPVQAAALRALGCPRAQGWFYGRAVPAQQAARMLAGTGRDGSVLIGA